MLNKEQAQKLEENLLYFIKKNDKVSHAQAWSECCTFLRIQLELSLGADQSSDIAHRLINNLFQRGVIFASKSHNFGIEGGPNYPHSQSVLSVSPIEPSSEVKVDQLFQVKGKLIHLFPETKAVSIYAADKDAAKAKFAQENPGWTVLSIVEVPQTMDASELENLLACDAAYFPGK